MSEITPADHSVELIVRDTSPPQQQLNGDSNSVSEEITPLLKQASEKPKINIFPVSYSRGGRPSREQVKSSETEVSPVIQLSLWVWSGSRYSGLLCASVSSILYFIMEVLAGSFSVQAIPLFEIAFTRCGIVLALSYFWLRRSGQPVFGPANARTFLFLRAIMGILSLFGFIYSIQKIPLSQAIVLSMTTPIMAAIAARVILREKLKISDIGGLACSFFGVIFMFRQMLRTQGQWHKAGETNSTVVGANHHIYAVLVGLFSSVTGGISHCLIQAGSKASDQPVATVFSFGIIASPAAALCTLAFEEFVVPDIHSIFLMLMLGVTAFFVEVFLARGLQLEKISKIANIVYAEVVLSQLRSMALSKVPPSFGGLVGCLLILISVCCTMYIGPDREVE